MKSHNGWAVTRPKRGGGREVLLLTVHRSRSGALSKWKHLWTPQHRESLWRKAKREGYLVERVSVTLQT